MRKVISVLLVTALAVIFSGAGYAADNPVNKLGRGFCNIVTFHFEIFEQSKRIKAKEGSLKGMTYGLGKGVVMACVRLLVGAYEVATFPVPYPENYGPILKDPVSFFPAPKEGKK